MAGVGVVCWGGVVVEVWAWDWLIMELFKMSGPVVVFMVVRLEVVCGVVVVEE